MAVPYFDLATWLWNPIKASPTLDANSAQYVQAIWNGGANHGGASLYDYGCVVVDASQITSSTNPTRYDVPLLHETGGADPWGANPFGSGAYLPIPTGIKLPPMHATYDATGENYGDAHYAAIDPIDGKVKSIWQLERLTASSYKASFGGIADLHGDGRETSGSSTAAGFSRPAGLVRIAEFGAAVTANTGLNHALFMSISATAASYRFPAIKSDGNANDPVPMGTRFQLNPSINVDAISGITAGEKVIAKTLQTYGVYVGDSSGGACNILFEFDQTATAGSSNNPTTNPGTTYKNAGFTSDYFDMSHIPWNSMRALATAEIGSAPTTDPDPVTPSRVVGGWSARVYGTTQGRLVDRWNGSALVSQRTDRWAGNVTVQQTVTT